MTKTTEAARKLAVRITEQYQAVGSWRKVADCYPPVVTFQTLNRIAATGGEWLPRNRKILRALGLIAVRKPEPEHTRRIKRKIAKMAKQTREAVIRKVTSD